jgi:hypothetical protein
MFMTDVYAGLPGVTTARETYEAGAYWGPDVSWIVVPGYISASTIDSGNTPTWEVRIGLVLGQQTATGQWINYSPTATDGSEVASGVLFSSLRIQDLTGVNQPRFYAVIVGGRVQSAQLLGLDGMARQQMGDYFKFDDDPPGRHWYQFKRFQSKTANYTMVAADNLSVFDNVGATGPVTFTLPPIANGFQVTVRVQADQNVLVTSNEGGNIIAFNNAVANTLAFQTGGARIGGAVTLIANPGATKWVAFNESIGANTLTVS